MKRNEFLKTAGTLGIASLIPSRLAGAIAEAPLNPSRLLAGSCVLIPQETAGPYPIDLTGNPAMFRQDIAEGGGGIPLHLTLTVVNVNDNCSPIANARFDIWHNNKDGYYSGFANQPGYLGTQSHVGETFCRGIQITDHNGQVLFHTIYPGWYPGRVTHFHFEVYLNSVLKATSQACFPDSQNTAVYSTSEYSAHGQNPTTNATDGVFSDSANSAYQMLEILPDTAGGFSGALTIGIAAPVTGVVTLEPETGGQFKFDPIYPNPFTSEATIAVSLLADSDVTVEMFDLTGRKVMDVLQTRLDAGPQRIAITRNMGGVALQQGSYVVQLTVRNDTGMFRQCKVVTAK